jgi:hypothetical protein
LSERPAEARRRADAPDREAGFAFALDFDFVFVVERLRALADFEPPDLVAICASSSSGVG